MFDFNYKLSGDIQFDVMSVLWHSGFRHPIPDPV